MIRPCFAFFFSLFFFLSPNFFSIFSCRFFCFVSIVFFTFSSRFFQSCLDFFFNCFFFLIDLDNSFTSSLTYDSNKIIVNTDETEYNKLIHLLLHLQFSGKRLSMQDFVSIPQLCLFLLFRLNHLFLSSFS